MRAFVVCEEGGKEWGLASGEERAGGVQVRHVPEGAAMWDWAKYWRGAGEGTGEVRWWGGG